MTMPPRVVRRGSAYVSPVNSSSDSSDTDDEATGVTRRGLQWRRRRTLVSSSSSSSSSDSNDEQVDGDDDDDTDALEDFVGRRATRTRAPSVAKLERLRRIFLNKPPAPKNQKPQPSKRRTNDGNQDAQSTTTSNSSGSGKQEQAQGQETVTAETTLAIDHHVTALRDQVQRLARHHDAHAQQWQAMLTQAIEELTFVKQHEERALQSHVRLLHESYALRLEVFEQQYRAKVAEIRDGMRTEIAQQRQQSEAAVLAAAQRLQQQTMQLFQSDDTPPSLPLDEDRRKATATTVHHNTSVGLAKTSAFLDRQRARDDARCRRAAEAAPPAKLAESPPTTAALSPVSKQRAKLRVLEQKLASFSPETIDRVVRTVEQQARERRDRFTQQTTELRPPDKAGVHAIEKTTTPEPMLRPAPLSPLRRRASYWHNGISREVDGVTGSDSGSHGGAVTRQSHNHRFLRPEEERELRTLRNRIGLAKDWMEDAQTGTLE